MHLSKCSEQAYKHNEHQVNEFGAKRQPHYKADQHQNLRCSLIACMSAFWLKGSLAYAAHQVHECAIEQLK